MRKTETILQLLPHILGSVLLFHRFLPVSTGTNRWLTRTDKSPQPLFTFHGSLFTGHHGRFISHLSRLTSHVLVGAWLFLATQLAANAQTNWNVVTGDWTNASNWTNGVPTQSTAAFIANDGTAMISTGDNALALSLNLGGAGGTNGLIGAGGTLIMSDGILDVTNDFTLGGSAGNGGNGSLRASGANGGNGATAHSQ
jgi:hypothetical protein